jgi:hypothetical protein
VSVAHPIDTQTEMVSGAFYALMFDWAHLEGHPRWRQAPAAASFAGDSLGFPP